MDDTTNRRFFEQPTQTYHRRYEALRAVFVDQQSQKEIAQKFGFTYGSMRQLVREFRLVCTAENERTDSPFFEMSMPDAPSGTMTKPPIRPSPIDESSYSRRANRYGSGQEPPVCFCSCLYWPS